MSTRKIAGTALLCLLVVGSVLGLFWYTHSNPETRPAGSTLSVTMPDATGVTAKIEHFAPNEPYRDQFELKAEINRIPDGSVAAFVFTTGDGSYAINRFEEFADNESYHYRTYLTEEGTQVRLVITHRDNLERLSKLRDANGEYKFVSLEREGLALVPNVGVQLYIPFLGDTP